LSNPSDKALSLLGMCRKSGNLSCGHDASVGSIKSGKAKLCILSSDSSERLRKETAREIGFTGKDIKLIISPYTMNEIGQATGLKSALITVNDEGFSSALIKLLTKQEEE